MLKSKLLFFLGICFCMTVNATEVLNCGGGTADSLTEHNKTRITEDFACTVLTYGDISGGATLDGSIGDGCYEINADIASTISDDIELINNATLTISAGVTVTELNGSFKINSGSTLIIDGTVSNVTSDVLLLGGDLQLNGNLTAEGKLELSAGAAATLNGGNFTSSSSDIIIKNPSSLALTNGSTIQTPPGQTLSLESGATITSDGQGNTIAAGTKDLNGTPGVDYPRYLAYCSSYTCDEVAGFIVIESGGSTETSENLTGDSFQVFLILQPSGTVELTITSNDLGEFLVNTVALIFTPGNYSNPQTVLVSGVDDALNDNDITDNVTISINQLLTSSDYDAVADQNVSVTNFDNEHVNPTAQDFSKTTDEDTEVFVAYTNLNYSDADGQAMDQLEIVTAPASGTLFRDTSPFGTFEGTDVILGNGSTLTFNQINNGRLGFIPDANEFGTPYITFTYRVYDEATAYSSGSDFSNTQTVTINVNAINDPPAFSTSGDVSVLEDFVAQQTVTVTPGPIPSDETGQTVTYSLSPSSVSFATIGFNTSTGEVTIDAIAEENGSQVFTITADDGQAANNTAVQNFTLTVTAVNDAPSFTKGSNIQVNEDDPAQNFAGWATSISKGAPNESGQILTFQVTPANASLFAAGPAIDPSTGNLTFTPAGDAFGVTNVDIKLTDDGGTANSGLNSSATETISIELLDVNDEPSFTLAGYVVKATNSTAQNIVGYASSIYPGAANESSQTLTFTVTNDNNGLFDVQPDINETTGNLTFTAKANTTGLATVSVSLVDDGGTLRSGDDTSPVQTFDIRITDPPFMDKGLVGKPEGTEDTELEITFATILSETGANDPDGTLDAFLVTSLTSGTLKIGTSSGTATAYAAGTNDFITSTLNAYWKPADDDFGDPLDAFNILAVDNDGLTSDQGATANPPQAVQPKILAVNDPPSFTKGANQLVGDTYGPQTVSGWAIAISAGPANESDQIPGMVFEYPNITNSAIFDQLPQVDPSTGDLTFTPKVGQFGVSTVDIRLKDGGGEYSTTQQFTIEVKAAPTLTGFTGTVRTTDEDTQSNNIRSDNHLTANATGLSDPDDGTFTSNNDNPKYRVTEVISGMLEIGGTPYAAGSNDIIQEVPSQKRAKWTPAQDVNGASIAAFKVVVIDLDGLESLTSVTVNVEVTSVNDKPTITTVSSPLKTTPPSTEVEITFAEIAAAADEADVDGTVDGFEVGSVPQGTLKIGVTSGSATAYNASTNNTIDASNNGYWTPPAGTGLRNAIQIRAKDDLGATSTSQETVQILVGTNTAPTAGATIGTNEDVGVAITDTNIAYSDGDGDPLDKIKITSLPAKGTLFLDTSPFEGVYDVGEEVSLNQEITATQLSSGYLIFIGDQDENGTGYTTFNIQVNDGLVYSSDATITMDVTAVNDDPTITSIADQSTNEDINKTGIAFIVDEGGGSDEDVQVLTVTATSSNTTLVPNGNITVNYTDNGGSSASVLSPTINITPAPDLSGTTTITVTIQDNGTGAPSVVETFVLTVNQVAEYSATLISGSTGESATTATFDAVLNSKPNTNVVITVTSGDTGEGTVDLASLTFTPANWDTPQTVTVTGVDDDIIDGDITYNVTLSVDDANSDNDFDPLADQTVSVTNTDDDVAGFTITETAASTDTDESATTDTFDVELDAEPGSNVVLTVTSDDTGEGTVDQASLTFTPANWDTPQTVTVTGVDDDIIDGDITYNVTLSVDAANSDDDFDPLADQTVSVTNTDDDVAGFTITETAATTDTDESATTDTFDVELDAEPGSNVVITVTSGDTGEGTVDKATLTFTPANWDTPQTVTVTGVDDDIIDGDITYNVTLSVDDASSDNDFDPLADQTVSVTNTDDDVAGFTITETAASTETDESATTDTFDVELDAEPGSNVVITVTSGDTGEGTVDLASLTFTPANWDTPQTVTVTGVDDDIIDGDITYNVTLSVDDANSDDDFDPLADQTVSVTNTDDDVAGFTITETAASTETDESATTDTFDVELDAEPGSNVVITVTSADTGEGTVDQASLTFTPANWDTPQTVTVTGVDDDIIDGDITYNVTLSVDDANSDNDFDPLADQTVSVTNTDDDVAGFTITETAASTETDESATTDTFDVELDAEPGSNVVITVTSGDTGEGTVDKATLTFTPANWDTPQMVTVTGVDDDIIDGDITYNVTLSVDDANSDDDFDPLADQTVSVTNTDDDVAGFTITETAASTETDESATTDTFDVELDAEPGSNVVITVTSGDTGEGTVDKATLTFTPANWDTPQTVTVTGVDDDIIDGDITYNVTLSVDDANSDDDFDPLADQTVSVTNTDDDVAGFTITETAASTGTDESATTDTFDVELDAEPGSNVVITVTSADTGEGTVDKTTLTFTPANWDTPQTVTVTGVDDDIIDGDITYNVTLSVDDANSNDDFDPLGDQMVSVTNTDDDVAGFTITETAASTDTDESATTDTFDVELDAEPGSNVVITVTSANTGEGTVDLASLTFTPANWDTPQTVTVTGVDDDIIDGDITYNVTLSVEDANSDDDFDPLADQMVSVTNTDDDVAGFTITETVASTDTDESATTDTFDVELDAEPGSNVVITVTSGDTGEGTVDKATLTFTPANWDTPQTVTVTGVDDDIIDGDITYNVTLSVDDANSDDDFDPLADQMVSVTNTDDDVAGFTITETVASTDTDESATTDTFDVELDAEPGSNVVITVTSGDTGEGTLDKASLTFTPANWDTPQTVTVTGVDDDIIDGDITYNVTLSVDDANSDDDFDPLADQAVSVTNTDDDVAGFTITETVASTDTDESATTDTFDVELDAEPGSNVVLTVTSDDTGEGTVDKASLTFTPANWDTPQTVTVTGVDDDIIDGDITYNVTLSVDDANSDDDFDPQADQAVSVTNTDDDLAGFTITETAASTDTDESATTDTFDVELDAEPGSNVVITVTSGDTGEGTVDQASLTFTPVNWDTPQTVTVTGVDDDIIDGDITYNVTLSVDDANSDDDFDPLADQTVSVTNTDDDVAGFTLSKTTSAVAEGNNDTFTIVLDAQPSSDVVIDLSSDDTGAATVSPGSLTFTSVNWNSAQTVTIMSLHDDDLQDETPVITVSVNASSDGDFTGLANQNVTVTVTDDDIASISISAISGNTREDGTTATFTIVLDSEPTADVTIGLSSDNTAEGTVSPSSVTFTTANWNVAQMVTITGVDDAIDDGDVVYTILTAAATSPDTNYNGLDPADVTVTNEDNDGVGISVSAISGNTGEDGTTASFTIVLDSEPTADVTIGLSSDNTSEGTVSPASVTFTNSNWNVQQTVTATGVDDAIDDGDVVYNIVTAAATSSDTNYNGLDPADVSITNEDNDGVGISVSAISGNTREDGSTATFTIVLDSEPTADVAIGLSSDNTAEGTVSPSSVTFTTANWNVAQMVTVTGVDDAIDDGDVVYTIVTAAATSPDTNYNGLDPADVTVTNEDNDGVGISVSAISGNTGEDGSTATFTIVLDSEPTADVAIGLSSDNTAEGTVSPASVTFTTANWNIPQTVTVTGVDDAIDDGDVVYTIVTAAATSSDTNYNGLDPADVTVTNEDNDGVGISVSAISGNTGEDGSTATFTIVLDSEPTADVAIGLSSDNTAEGTVSPSSVTFTTANWNVAQMVTVTGVDDAIDDGDVVYNIVTAAATSPDTNYNGLDPADVTVTNEDNDGVGISVSAISGNTGEDGSTASFTIVLDSEPTADVTIGLSSDNTAEGTVSPSSVTFTTANWNVPQMVTVTGVDDNDVDGDVTYTIIISAAASSDANYNGLDPTNVVLINEDDDSINGTPVITGQVSINSIDEDTDFTIALTNLTVTDPDNNYPADHTLILLTGNDYDISGSSIIPQADYNGALRVNIKVSDGVNESNVYEYEVDIRPVNDKPILVADALTGQFGNTLEGNLLTNDSDVENDELVLTDISPLPGGLIFNTDGSFMYSGDTEIGTIEMDYVVCDDGDPSECAQSTFTLTIEGGDFDGDGIPDSYEIQFDDVDDDGEPEYRDLDSDNDGISDSQEAGADPENPVDTDQDGTPDFLDMDSDGDGKLDSEEGVEDCDRDGILNYIDNDDPCKMKIADAFSPNGDGKNDEWIIQGIESYPGNKVTIFNRWGNKIFEIDGYDNNSRVWRGEINTNIGSDKNASYSTYYFIIDLKDGSKPIAGNVLISR